MRGVVIAALLLAGGAFGACSFVTSFPDIEVVGGGGVGGGGGDAPCVNLACQNCLTPDGSCPVPTGTIRLIAPASQPSEFAASEVEVIEIVQKSDGPRYVGNYLDTQAFGLEVGTDTLTAGDQKVGFILGPNRELLAGLGAVDTEDMPSGTEARMTSATVADGKLVVAGVFIGPKLVVCPETIGTGITGQVTAPPGAAATDFIPFVMWFFADTDFVQFAMNPVTPGGDLENGYVSDIAALPGDAAGRIAAIGHAGRDPFGLATEFENAVQRYYVVISAGSNASKEVTLDKSACGNFSELDGLRSSIAVDSSRQIWVAGTGCPLDDQGVDQSFITRFEDATLEDPITLTLDGSPIGITEIAVSDAIIAVAGTYSGVPIESLQNTDPIEAGEPGDAFVMAFTRDGWGNQSKPIWFRRFASGGGAARIEALAVDNGRVFIGGRMGATGGFGDRTGCWESAPPGRGRAFFAQLSELEGSLDWLNVEGFEAAGTENVGDLFARGMALSPVDGGLLTATGFHGELLLECGPDATNDTGNPEVWLRTFDFQ